MCNNAFISFNGTICVICSLDYDDPIRDGFFDPWGDWPEVLDQPTEFPTLANLRRVQALDEDPREVSVSRLAGNNLVTERAFWR